MRPDSRHVEMENKRIRNRLIAKLISHSADIIDELFRLITANPPKGGDAKPPVRGTQVQDSGVAQCRYGAMLATGIISTSSELPTRLNSSYARRWPSWHEVRDGKRELLEADFGGGRLRPHRSLRGWIRRVRAEFGAGRLG